ncbi:Mitochondrial distribution and morphology protein 12 [Vanrija pseudolonga]|uniref:Mitochondrial distribution and morphology protein 12 n=1 Tax=Vanrija pseudolonga TaxID=143232 RepID=A0AAF1BFA9_9TREE|nr:Mitochondrial distribution and morphology protein 12 [Vanrija pseudolonga]
MSVDIDWSLLASSSSSLSTSLISALNTQLNTAARPSFLGPITVTAFDFGHVGPEVEIKDVRDVWRAFDDGDDEGDAEVEARLADERGVDEFHPPPQPAPARRHRARNGSAASAPPSAFQHTNDDDDRESVYSGLASARNSVASVGIGLGAAAVVNLRRGARLRPPATPPRVSPLYAPPTHQGSRVHAPSSPPPSPPARPAGLENARANPLPSVQIHLRIDHAADLTLALLTTLQVNYPSKLFMALPLKLVITGLTLAADVVLAYSGPKHRVHVTIVDSDEGGSTPAGQRILPHLHIESEIGSSDAHVLRNVGKVERFIVDVVRKTLVDELVFPNFHTIAL